MGIYTGQKYIGENGNLFDQVEALRCHKIIESIKRERLIKKKGEKENKNK